MSLKLLRSWPILPAILILYFGVAYFFRHFPKLSHRIIDTQSELHAPDSLLAFIQSERHFDSLIDTSSSPAQDTLATTKSPFRSPRDLVSAIKPSHTLSKGVPPIRKYVLKGTVGNQVATIQDPTGQKHIVKVGEQLDSATVVSIESNKVVLKDRAGKFELQQEP